MQLSEVLKNTNRIQDTMHDADKNEGIIASDYAAAKDNTALKITIREQRFARMKGYFEILASVLAKTEQNLMLADVPWRSLPRFFVLC